MAYVYFIWLNRYDYSNSSLVVEGIELKKTHYKGLFSSSSRVFSTTVKWLKINILLFRNIPFASWVCEYNAKVSGVPWWSSSVLLFLSDMGYLLIIMLLCSCEASYCLFQLNQCLTALFRDWPLDEISKCSISCCIHYDTILKDITDIFLVPSIFHIR